MKFEGFIGDLMYQSKCPYRIIKKDELEALLPPAEMADEVSPCKNFLEKINTGITSDMLMDQRAFIFEQDYPNFAAAIKAGLKSMSILVSVGTIEFEVKASYYQVAPNSLLLMHFSSQPTNKLESCLFYPVEQFNAFFSLDCLINGKDQPADMKLYQAIIPTCKTSKAVNVNKAIVIAHDFKFQQGALDKFVNGYVSATTGAIQEGFGNCIDGHMQCKYFDICPKLNKNVSITKFAA